MRILIDETGNFELKKIDDIAIVTLVTVPDKEEKHIIKLITDLQLNYLKPIKGTNIKFQDRLKLFTFLQNTPTIKYSTVLSSGSVHSQGSIDLFKKLQIEKLVKSIELPRKIGNTSLVKDLELLSNQANNLSTSDFVKFIFITNLIIEWERVFLYDYLTYPENSESWEFEFVIDTLNKPEKMQRIIKSFMYLTTNMLNPNFVIFLPKEWLPKHKFIEKYDTPAGLDAKKLFGNLNFASDDTLLTLKIPDLIGNTLLKTIRNPENPAYLELLTMIKDNRSIYMTKSNRKNYFIVTGLDHTKGDDILLNIKKIHKYLNFD